MKEIICNLINRVRIHTPIVHNITNYVVMNNSANALLAIGASPIMSHAKEEIEEMVSLCGSLVINIGTLDRFTVEAMHLAAKKAEELGKPVVLDPVGAGATRYRNETLDQLINNNNISYIRGNASEIIILAGNSVISRGVDSSESSLNSLNSALKLSNDIKSTICVSGQIDLIIDKNKICYIDNGSTLMTNVTGLGCSASAVLGAFAALKHDPFESAIAATALMAICGEIAAEKSEGPGTLQLHLYDALYNITNEQIMSRIKIRFA